MRSIYAPLARLRAFSGFMKKFCAIFIQLFKSMGQWSGEDEVSTCKPLDEFSKKRRSAMSEFIFCANSRIQKNYTELLLHVFTGLVNKSEVFFASSILETSQSYLNHGPSSFQRAS
jgi:hypothetical protein